MARAKKKASRPAKRPAAKAAKAAPRRQPARATPAGRTARATPGTTAKKAVAKAATKVKAKVKATVKAAVSTAVGAAATRATTAAASLTRAIEPTRRQAARAAVPAMTADGWLAAGKGYAVTLDGDKLVARNAKGARLGAVPKEVRDSDAAEQLANLKDWLAQHARECAATVETWMLRSLPVPRVTVQQVWDDPAWRGALENAIVLAAPGGVPDPDRGGFLRGVDPKKGVGVVDLDGETTWLLDADQLVIPHPILIAELAAWRELATQLGLAQGIAQLLRETHARPTELAPGQTAIATFADAKFAMLMHVLGKARTLGYRVRGGYATCTVWEAGTVTEARFWIGADSPDSETYTGDLAWVDGREHARLVAAVGPVAYSEGVRMASAIHAARVVDKEPAA